MTPEQSEKLKERLDFVENSKKEFDSEPSWKVIPDRLSSKLVLVTAVRLRGTLRGGVSIRLKTPIDAWEENVYGHVEVQAPGLRQSMRLCPVEWRPWHEHENAPNAPEAHRYVKLLDRWHPFDLNRDLDIGVFLQTRTGVAVPLPRAISSFSDYCDLCANVWRCSDMMDLAPPPWVRSLI